MKKTTVKASPVAKSSFYKLHRILGLTALVPVIFWTLSGLSHPLMSNWFRPFIPREVFKSLPQNKMNPAISIQQVMDKNKLTELRNFSLINFDKGTFYQVLNKDSVYNYYSAANGKLLPEGDKSYAIYLARYFTQDTLSPIKSIRLQTSFDGQYQPINHLLPVWKVSFNRADGMDIYVETAQNRMGTFNNNTRKVFLWLFEQFHTWQFLASIGGEHFRVVVLLILVSIMFLSLLSGLTVYGLFWKRFKEIQQKRKAKGSVDKRFIHRYHRQVGLTVSALMFTFVTSGAFHLFVVLHNLKPEKAAYQQIITRENLNISNLQLPLADSNIIRTTLVQFNNNTYYQVLTRKKQIHYINTADGLELPDGDIAYATYLSNYYHGISPQKTYQKLKVTQIRQFNNDYGFINKRLPVEEVSYPDGNWYIETTSAKLATKVAGIDRAEGLSFIFLHKFFWMTWAGKDVRDIVSMLAALGVLAISLLGLTAFIKNK